jgi:hypothetical protein
MGVPPTIMNTLENVRQVLPQQLNCQPVKYDSVNTEYFASMIAPELFSHQQPNSASMPTALATTRCTYNINTNASGSLGVYAFPYNACQANALQYLNNAVFDPVAGTQTGFGPTSINGPLIAQASVIRLFKVTAFSMRIIDNLPALTKSGTATSVVFYEIPNATIGTNVIVFPITDVGSFASCTITGASALQYSRRSLVINK